MGRDRARGVKGSCSSKPPPLGGTSTEDAAVAGTEDAAVASTQQTQQQCPRLHQTLTLPSPASPHVWSKSSGGTFRRHRGVCYGSFLEEPFRLQDNNVTFCPIVLKPLKEVPCICWIQEPNVMHTIMTEGDERRFPARFLVIEHEVMQQIIMSYFMPESPKPFQRSPSYFPDTGTKDDIHDNGVCSVHNLSRLKIQPQPAYYCFQTQAIHELLHENLHQENASRDTHVISMIDFRHDHCK